MNNNRGYTSCTFLGDWFRAAPHGARTSVIQLGNVAWLSRLLAPAVDAALPLSQMLMPSSDTEIFAEQLGSATLFEEFRVAPDDSWATAYSGETERRCFTCLYECIPADSLVVGFEIPPVMKREIAARGIDYISLHIHPVRFLRDLAFGFYTNARHLADSLACITCDPHVVTRQASRFAARLARLDPVQSRLPNDIPVLFGQTAVDSSLIFGGRFVRWQDYAEDLAASLASHDEIAFLRHPLASWRPDIVDFLRIELGKTVIGIAGNGYSQIMSSRRLGPTFTLSSSIGVEAAIFGYDCRFLLADPREKFAIVGLDHFVPAPLDHRLFEPAFWHELVVGSGQGIKAREESFHMGDNFVRGTIQNSRFAGLEEGEPFAPMEKLIVPAIGCASDRLDELAGMLSGAALDDRCGAVAEAARNGIELKLVPSPLAIGGSWAWDSSVPLSELPLLSGFYPVEAGGAWSEGRTCVFELPIEGKGDLLLNCEADFSFCEGFLDERPALLVRCNGTPAAGLIHRPGNGRGHSLNWVARVRAPGICVITFESSHAVQLSAPNSGGDARNLGIMLHRLSVSARRDSGDGAGDALRLWGLGSEPIDVSLG